MKASLLAVPVALILTACVSTEPAQNTQTTIDAAPAKAALTDQHWSARLPDEKMALRSCILADKNINAILYLEKSDKATTLVVEEKNGAVKNCVVGHNQKAKLLPFEDQLPSHITRFYPVGKKVGACAKPTALKDGDNRLMGTVCQ
ncbi:transposase [Wohlfahrtiimonas chitiniclastica]|uniref:transposase n=1 Tax=Wohlfahrtiimonas chitiniclastica TaxID=400946 RepID=UPI001BCAE04E|nr:transposase [Wohlfahrtiimonas chitiniclastica]MBS7820585.1 transposase [Wohlfahrtiimonas chitiniclastica]